MSADAKVWQDGEGWFSWKGLHDGPCFEGVLAHDQGANLVELLLDIEKCQRRPMRWELFTYTDGTVGIQGYQA
jgi:hypothetical protein